MAITDFEFPRFRRKAKDQNGAGEQVLNPTGEREKRIEEEAAAAITHAEVDLILYFTRKQWRLIRISSFLYVLSCIFLLLVSSCHLFFPCFPKYRQVLTRLEYADRNRQHKQ